EPPRRPARQVYDHSGPAATRPNPSKGLEKLVLQTLVDKKCPFRTQASPPVAGRRPDRYARCRSACERQRGRIARGTQGKMESRCSKWESGEPAASAD